MGLIRWRIGAYHDCCCLGLAIGMLRSLRTTFLIGLTRVAEVVASANVMAQEY